MLIAVLGVGGYFVTLNIYKNNALEKIDTVFSLLKEGNVEEIKKYISPEEFNQTSENSDEENMSDESMEMLKILFKNLNYEVVSTDMKLNEAVIKLNVTNKDAKEIFTNYFSKALSLSMSGTFDDKSEEEKDKELIKYFE